MIMPLLFAVPREPKDYHDPSTGEIDHYMVIIPKKMSYVGYDSKWWNDDTTPHLLYRFDLDIEGKRVYFETEEEAFNYIADWWRLNS